MTFSKFLLPLTLGIFLMSSCKTKLTPFTQQLYEEQQWTDEELKRIQFYISEDIVLFRELRKGDSRIVSGEIKIRNGRKVDEVVIKKGTPGVLLFRPNEDKFAISFEEGNDERYLVFGPSRKRGRNGKYGLLSKDWGRRFGKVTYGGRIYNATSNSAYAALMVDLKRLKDTEVRSRVAKGRKVD
ncbi:MAG: hypothetical protein AAF573_05340 [Bacteroidota bacterium]